jgi:hypothetical protein
LVDDAFVRQNLVRSIQMVLPGLHFWDSKDHGFHASTEHSEKSVLHADQRILSEGAEGVENGEEGGSHTVVRCNSGLALYKNPPHTDVAIVVWSNLRSNLRTDLDMPLFVAPLPKNCKGFFSVPFHHNRSLAVPRNLAIVAPAHDLSVLAPNNEYVEYRDDRILSIVLPRIAISKLALRLPTYDQTLVGTP